jgi:hypothetical protein
MTTAQILQTKTHGFEAEKTGSVVCRGPRSKGGRNGEDYRPSRATAKKAPSQCT